MAKVLIVAEHDGRSLAASTAKCVSCALELAPESVDVALFSDGTLSDDTGDAPPAIAAEAARIRGVTRVLHLTGDANSGQVSAALAPQLASLAAGYTHLLGPSTTFGKDLMPRAAALLGVGQISDIMAVEGEYRFKRPIYAGNAVVTVDAAPDRLLVGTVRMASYSAAPADAQPPAAVEQRTEPVELPSHTRFVELEAGTTDRPDLQTAARVVAGGRAFGSAENFQLLYRLADALGAAVGASRAAVDAGLAANELQVGQTGKVIAPELYFAIGISGAIQHLTGIKDAGVIVAVNKDPDAPIFEIADIGLVGDLFEVVPALIEALEKG